MSDRTGNRERAEGGLPPREMRLWNVRRQGKIPTPLDDDGIVDLDCLIELGKTTVHEDYDWSSREDLHHLQWPRALYMRSSVLLAFRELRQRKVVVPRQFHNWIHYITEEPPLPSEEVASTYIKADRVAQGLAATARLAVRISRIPNIPEIKRKERLRDALDLYRENMDNIEYIPSRLHPLPVEELEVNDVDELLLVSKKLGKRAIRFVHDKRRYVSS